eukprot:COSAG04_NODE_10118_length_802_cov_2229.132290_1_plen_89_part_00
MDGSGATQNGSEMAEATQIAKQVHRCEKGGRPMELRDGEMDGEIARLAWMVRRWRWGVCGAENCKGFCDKNRHKVPQRESKSGIMQRG